MTGETLFADAQVQAARHGLLDRGVMRLGAPLQTVAALYVEPKGCYVGAPGVDQWDEARDARTYAGPHPVVAHPPCQRWGRFWHGSTRKPHQYKLGDDGGCFVAAFIAVKRYGGVLEHPAHSRAFEAYNILKPEPGRGWQFDPFNGVYVCHVEQGHYGHMSRKATWLIAAGVAFCDLPELNWTKGEQRLPEWMIERYGYEKARRIGVVAMVGGKNKTAIRNATPEPFRDLLLSIARQAHNRKANLEPTDVNTDTPQTPAVGSQVERLVGRPERAAVGDVVACDVRHPYPQTLRLALETQDAADHANTLLTLEPKVWRLEKRIIFARRVENAHGNLPATQHCQNGGDVCLAGNHDGVCCPEDSCDIDDGMRKPPNVAGKRMDATGGHSA